MPASDSYISLQQSAKAKRRWALEPDRSAATKPAFDGRMRKFYEQVDKACPGLAPDERERRARSLLSAEMQERAAQSIKARQDKATAKTRKRSA